MSESEATLLPSMAEEEKVAVDEEEERLLEGYLKKNQAAEPSKFTLLYVVVALISVLAVSYLYHAILDLPLANKINAALYILVGGLSVYLLSESYKQMYETLQTFSLTDTSGKWIKELEERRLRRHATIPEGTPEMKVPGGAQGLSAKEIYIRTQKGSEESWKKLGKAERQVYASQEAKAAVKYLGYELAEVNNLLYQQSMGWALFFTNAVFITLALLISQLALRNYDTRVSFVVSTAVNGVLTHLLVKYYESRNKEEQSEQQKRK